MSRCSTGAARWRSLCSWHDTSGVVMPKRSSSLREWRVSSASTTAAERSTRTERAEASPRFPIGVPTTYSPGASGGSPSPSPSPSGACRREDAAAAALIGGGGTAAAKRAANATRALAAAAAAGCRSISALAARAPPAAGSIVGAAPSRSQEPLMFEMDWFRFAWNCVQGMSESEGGCIDRERKCRNLNLATDSDQSFGALRL